MTSEPTTTGAALVADSLRAIGVDTVFEVPGDPIGAILTEAGHIVPCFSDYRRSRESILRAWPFYHS